MFIEAAVDTLGDALAAEREGVDRVELCGVLHDGAVTPSIGLITTALASVRTPIHVFVRPRLGNFVYDAGDITVMRADIAAAREAGAPGVVFGALTREGTIDREVMARLIDHARPMVVGFHRAFDTMTDQEAALETLIDLGVSIVLTSGGAPRASDGAPQLRRLVQQSAGRIEILAGGSVTPDTVADLLAESGVTHVHGRAFRGLRRSV